MADTELLVVGAGPYAYSAAAYARNRGIGTRIVGRPMGFWRDHMPAGMYLRSGRDWSLDAAGQHSFAAYFEERGLDPQTHDPIPIGVSDHTEWFAEQKRLGVEQILVDTLTRPDGLFAATMSDGSTITAEKVLAAPGIAHFANLPEWYAEVPADRLSHTSGLVSFDDLRGARVAVIGGRQSAYEWAALAGEHGAERVDVVHRHETPALRPCSWAFVDPLVEQTLRPRGWWRTLPRPSSEAIGRGFWQVGRLTLEHWLEPRLKADVVHTHARAAVTSVRAGAAGITLTLSDGGTGSRSTTSTCASGYRSDLAAVPRPRRRPRRGLDHRRLPRPVPREVRDDPARPLRHRVRPSHARDFRALYLRLDTKGCPSSARIAVDEMLR